MKKSCVCILMFLMTMICMMGEENVYVLAETVSDNQLLEEQQEQEMYEEAELRLSGYCGLENENGGKNVSYTISDSDNDGIYDLLEIQGIGGIRSGYKTEALPWQVGDNRIKIAKVVIEEGITSIGDWSFSTCKYLREIIIPESVNIIGNHAFYN